MEMSERQLHEAVTILARGGVIAYPTDTVYGLGADASNADAVLKIRQIKQRVDEKPILALVADMAMLEEYAEVTPMARVLAESFLPGPLSLILTPRDDRLAAIMGRDGAVGFRMPNHKTCMQLASVLGRPITSTSLNKAGQPQARTLKLMLEQLGEQAAMIDDVLDAGELPKCSPSTVVDVRGDTAVVIREGAIPKETLHRFL